MLLQSLYIFDLLHSNPSFAHEVARDFAACRTVRLMLWN